MKIEVAGEDSLMIYFGDEIDTRLPAQIQQLANALTDQLGDQLIDLIPAYTSLLVIFDSLCLSHETCRQIILNNQSNLQKSPGLVKTHHRIPVCYHPSLGFDLQSLAKAKQLSCEQVIARHSATIYQVYALGFSPAFAYLGQVATELVTPRHASPRLKVPAGSVGIADNQTAIYPIEGPGGWQIIGRTPWDLSLNQPNNLTRFQIGDQVQFMPIDLDTYHQQLENSKK